MSTQQNTKGYDRNIESAGLTADSVTAEFWRLHSYLTNALNGRVLWTIKGPKNTLVKNVHAYQVGGVIFMVQEYKKCDGWNIFIPAHNGISISETLTKLQAYLATA